MSREQFRACIEACYACAAACDRCAAACLKEDEVKMMARCIAMDVDCAEICRTAAAFMARDGEWARQVCGLCAQVCKACAEECARHQAQHCQDCAQACARCAEECGKMAA